MSSSTGSLKYGSAKKRVNTTPTWVRKLPPDELELLFDEQAHAGGGDDTTTAWSTSSRRSGQAAAGSTSRSRTDAKAAAGAHQQPQPAHQHRPSTSSAGQTTLSPTSSAEDSPSGPGQPGSSNRAGPTPLQPAHSTQDVRRGNDATLGQDRWWTFTLPQKYLDRVHDYLNGQQVAQGTGGDHAGGKDKEKARDDDEDEDEDERRSLTSTRNHHRHRDVDAEKQEYHRSMSMSMGARLAPPGVFSMNQAQTPGWSSPWAPFHHDGHGDHRDPFTIAQANAQRNKSRMSRFERFILRNAFTPLLFRFVNLVFTACTLALAAHIREQERRSGLIGVVGSSTLFCIVVAPVAILHIFITVYIEYFGSPIGIWSLGSKMAHTLTELIFICLWSAILSLSFDDLFTSALECTDYTPYAEYNTPPLVAGSADRAGTLADKVCGQQVAIVVFVFVQVFLYAGILIVSLFRIFHKVSRKN